MALENHISYLEEEYVDEEVNLEGELISTLK